MDPELRKIIEGLLDSFEIGGKFTWENDLPDHTDCECCGARLWTASTVSTPQIRGEHEPDCALQALRKYMEDK